MKLRTSYFNPTAFRKDITRFAPSWALYTVFLLLVLIPMSGDGEWFASNLADCMMLMTVLNFLYAFLNVQLLFGDLFNSRMCNALHAMPLRREGWFLTHTAAGMVFSLVPNLLVCCVVMVPLGDMFYLGPLTVLAATLQYIFFFGLAVFSLMCVGNRFAMAVIYGILNFLSMLCSWFLATLYLPQLDGVVMNYEPFQWLSPVVYATSHSYVEIYVDTVFDGKLDTIVAVSKGVHWDTWLYVSVCALVGVALLGLALLLYRRRKLEAAGDFLAVKQVEPAFLVLYSLTVGAVLQMTYSLFNGDDMPLFLLFGVIIGFFTGRMLLKRTVRVFQPRAFAGLAALVVAVGASLWITSLDPMGIARWVPEPEQVSAVYINPPHYSGYLSEDVYFRTSDMTLTEPEDIEKAIEMHRLILEGENTGSGVWTPVTIRYQMKNGTSRERQYTVNVESPPGQILKNMLSSPECVFKTGDKEAFLNAIKGIEFDTAFISNEAVLRELGEALWQDAENGNLAQNWSFHPNESGKPYMDTWMHIDMKNDNSLGINIYISAENTLDWLYRHNYLDTESFGIQQGDWIKE